MKRKSCNFGFCIFNTIFRKPVMFLNFSNSCFQLFTATKYDSLRLVTIKFEDFYRRNGEKSYKVVETRRRSWKVQMARSFNRAWTETFLDPDCIEETSLEIIHNGTLNTALLFHSELYVFGLWIGPPRPFMFHFCKLYFHSDAWPGLLDLMIWTIIASHVLRNVTQKKWRLTFTTSLFV